MRNVYRVLAYAIAGLVAVQSATIAFAMFGLFSYIDRGGAIDKASMESESAKFTGDVGFMLHGMGGMTLIRSLRCCCSSSPSSPRSPAGSNGPSSSWPPSWCKWRLASSPSVHQHSASCTACSPWSCSGWRGRLRSAFEEQLPTKAKSMRSRPRPASPGTTR